MAKRNFFFWNELFSLFSKILILIASATAVNIKSSNTETTISGIAISLITIFALSSNMDWHFRNEKRT